MRSFDRKLTSYRSKRNENEEQNCIIALKHQIDRKYAKNDEFRGFIPASFAPLHMDPHERVRACFTVVKLPSTPPHRRRSYPGDPLSPS